MVSRTIDQKLLGIISSEQAHSFRIIPLEKKEGFLHFLSTEKTEEKKNLIQILLGKNIVLNPIPEEEIQPLLYQHYQSETLKNREKEQAEGSDVVRFVNKMFQTSIDMGASDIHVERYEKQARIRFRWEGQLVERYEVNLEEYDAIVSRIKIMAELDIAERRLPQDGRIHFQQQGQDIDVRVSSIPGKFGEKIVLRLLTRSSDQLDIQKLGFSVAEMNEYEQAITKPNGIILITGPTGSGKTTTLYATLSQLNKPGKNITTIEDPIEYNLSGINQVQLKEEIGLSFDRALRAFLRQDPDIMMVGEIRDTPTAQIAVRAALTGHLVFSTLHTNNSWDALSRLTDMGVEPYLLAAALRLILAQRLVRVLCKNCKRKVKTAFHEGFQNEFDIQEHFLPEGCPTCYFTGYRGRRAVFEVLPIGKDIQQAVKSLNFSEAKSMTKQLPSLNENLANLVRHGETSIEEAVLHYQ
ncbi:MAG: GspE/PulE family protein [Bacteroidia bacterium]|nr:GspE/PulE family protein [Bacteroidia bacterium]